LTCSCKNKLCVNAISSFFGGAPFKRKSEAKPAEPAIMIKRQRK
jgi:hypothetical protein